MIFDREDGCWLPAGLDSDTFPIFADRPLFGGAVPFGSHVSRRARPGWECGPRRAAGARLGGPFPNRAAFLPVGVGSEPGWDPERPRGRCAARSRNAHRPGVSEGLGSVTELSRETSADDSRLLSDLF